MARALIVSHDVVGPMMAGPGIRYAEMAAALRRAGGDVVLAAPEGSQPSEADQPILTYRLGTEELVGAARSSGAIVVTGPILEQFPALKGLGVPIVVDLYDPFLFENLHRLRGDARRWEEHEGGVRTLSEQARWGDYFICANERQRDLYIGLLCALGRVNPTTYDDDESLRRVIDVVPFGLPSYPPRAGHGIRGLLPGVSGNDRLVVWNGGLWDWFDPATAIRAISHLIPRMPELRLVFLGTRHPNPAIGEPETAKASVELARELGLLDRHVFFREWTPYAERGACLLDADAAISLHLPGIETRYASRTRLLDCIWTARPVVVTEGDAIGDEMVRRGLAVAVPPSDERAAAEAIALLVGGEPRARRPTFEQMVAELTWDRAVEPLARFLAAPRRAADRRPADEAHTRPEVSGSVQVSGRPSSLWERVRARL